MQVTLLSLIGEELLVLDVESGSTLGELRAQITASIRVEPEVELTLVLGECTLPKASQWSRNDESYCSPHRRQPRRSNHETFGVFFS